MIYDPKLPEGELPSLSPSLARPPFFPSPFLVAVALSLRLESFASLTTPEDALDVRFRWPVGAVPPRLPWRPFLPAAFAAPPRAPPDGALGPKNERAR